MDQLGFERVKEALHRGIVVAVGLSAHRCGDFGFREGVTVGL